MEDPKFHVLLLNEIPKFVYVGTPEEAAKMGAKSQKIYDSEDGVRSKWKRKRHVTIVSTEGQIGMEVLEKLMPPPKEEPKLIEAEVVIIEDDSNERK